MSSKAMDHCDGEGDLTGDTEDLRGSSIRAAPTNEIATQKTYKGNSSEPEIQADTFGKIEADVCSGHEGTSRDCTGHESNREKWNA